MPITHEDLGSDVRRIIVSGRLDMGGTKVMAPDMAELVGTPKKRLIVDLTDVQFLASIGIRMLIESAKIVQRRGDTMVLVVDGRSTVSLSLQATGIDDLIPVYKSLAEAQKAIAT